MSIEREKITACEGCSAPIYNRDQYHRGSDVDLCQECAPDYSDLLVIPGSFTDAEGEPLTVEAAQAIYDAHVDAGGSPDDKMVR